jgi:regulatory protein
MDTGSDKELKRGKAYCLRLLSLRPRSECEIEERLKSKGYSDKTKKQLLSLLKKDGLIDDVKYAGEWIDSRLGSNPKGKKALRIELIKKGIAREVIEQVFAEKAAVLDEKKIALGLIKKKLLKGGSKPDKNAKGKLFQFLLRKGFDAETAEEVVNEQLESFLRKQES